MTAYASSHNPSMNLRFTMRDGQRVLQQQFLPNNWNTHKEIWRDVVLHEERVSELDPEWVKRITSEDDEPSGCPACGAIVGCCSKYPDCPGSACKHERSNGAA